MNHPLTTIALATVLGFSAISTSIAAYAGDDDGSFAPGGTAVDQHTQQFHNLKVVMDLKVKSIDDVAFGAVTAGRIISHPGTKLVVIVEGPGVTAFAKKNYLDHQGTIDAWADLAQKGVKVEYCGNSVHGAGLSPADMTGLSEKNPAVVNPGAYPTIANYEAQGYGLVLPMLLEQPKK